MKKRINQMHAFQQELGGNKVIYSYDTPILIKHQGVWYDSPEKYSRTTSKQKTKIKNLFQIDPTELSHEEFVANCKKIGVENLGWA